MGGNVKVVVRCRPMNAREKARGATCIVRMEGNKTIIMNHKKLVTNLHQKNKFYKEEEDNEKIFTFDRSYWSVDKSDSYYADQGLIYDDLGKELLDHAFDGYNCCIFAYGQTGSGKSYSMIGYGEDKGIIPRTCLELFERISYLTDDTVKFQVEVSYIEIYNERVRDLLNPGNKGNLKVREHPTIGPYVEDLSRLVVTSYEDVDHLMNEGNKARTVAVTNMNETSSRSHAVFTLFLTSSRLDPFADNVTEKASRISLVDLAGSERANSTGATGIRLKEGANINKSLTTLGKVISALAEQSSQPISKRSSTSSNNTFIPYRDSVLTWLLKDSLGGNSKTAMIATISPADYDETLSTLRYADQAKRIKNKPVVNEDPNARIIRELKEELQALRDTLMIYAPEEVEKIIQQRKLGSRPNSHSSSNTRGASTVSPMLLLSPVSPIATQRGNSLLTKEQVIEQLQSSEKLLLEVNQTWEEKMKKTEEIHRKREKTLKELGIIVDKKSMGVFAPQSIHIINLNEDPLMTECLMYHIKPGITYVGRLESDIASDIRLSGPEIMDNHCYFENISSMKNTNKLSIEENYNHNTNTVIIYPRKDSVTLVNGVQIFQPKILHSGYRIIFGSGLHHLFRFNNPDEVRREREQLLQQCVASPYSMITVKENKNNFLKTPITASAVTNSISQSLDSPNIVDWSFAHNEALKKYGKAAVEGKTDFEYMMDKNLKQLSEVSTISPRTSISFLSNKHFNTLSSVPTVFTEIDRNENEYTKEDETYERDYKNTSRISKEEKEQLVKDSIQEIQHQLEVQKQEYEKKLKLVEFSHMKTDELNREKEELATKYTQIKQEMEKSLEKQKLEYESKIKRISAHLPPGTALSTDNLFVGHTSKNAAETLMRITINKWRQLRYVKMAEDCLVFAIILKEANIMAKELSKNVIYQFVIVHDNMSVNSLSFWESASTLQPFIKDPDTYLMKETKPCLAIQVIDHIHRTTYIWSILKLKQRLRRMRRLYDYSDSPHSTTQYFNHEDPFYETPCPQFSLIGLARIPLQNLTLQLHTDNCVDVYCRNSGKVMGQIRVLVTPIARSISRRHKQEPLSSSQKYLPQKKITSIFLSQEDQQYVLDKKDLLHIGQQQVFEIRIQELRGVSENEFTQVHAQFRLSSFGNVERYSAADKIYQTDLISNFGNSPIIFNQCQTLSINITENMMKVILNQGLTVEVYGQAQEKFLLGLVEHVNEYDSKYNSILSTEKPEPLKKTVLVSKIGKHMLTSRRLFIDEQRAIKRKTYDDIPMEERHDILSLVQVCELNSDGEYVPVKVVRIKINDTHHHIKHYQDIFCLRQGLQRRILITLSHDSGKQFKWCQIREVNVSNIRLLDNKGELIETQLHSAQLVKVHLFPERKDMSLAHNGISRMVAEGSWDSSLHDSVILNRITPSNQYVRLTLSWQVICEKCTTPLQFHMNISVQINGRDATIPSSSSSIRQFLLGGDNDKLNGTTSKKKFVHKVSGFFTVQLKPPLTRQVRELWRLNTANKYVRGEEFIGSWKPRGVSLITDYREARRKMLYRESVTATRHSLVLAGHPQTKAIQQGNYNSSQLVEQSALEDKKKNPEAILRKVIGLWRTQFGTRENIVFSQDPPVVTSLNSSSSNNSINNTFLSNQQCRPKLTAYIQQLYPSDTVTKKGFLIYLENVNGKWLKYWFVLRRLVL
ncbi:uncharacterized protein BX663DRAFT_526290 [Cokeromyces recurvatus]|uniref:uncharacterized protein n=1 Tax=Cokeromyces recurvatus TaxID=90255 RepID=UPI00221EEE60|nr:uncharacterized protein BX663DRAFT_526290 [Cokeromyces recurvatus]KAI7898006.1 hypothetical protein BX663DRAFT_526290 [Cokeromyces recurvatus]